MNHLASAVPWHQLESVAPTDLGDARETLHHAAQLLALVGASYIPPRPDDSHTSMKWLDERGALVTDLVDAARPFRVGLRLSDLTILVLDASNDETAFLPLAERTRDQAIAWLRARIGDTGRDPSSLRTALHFSIADHSTDHGAPFVRQPALEELSRWFENANALLTKRRAHTPNAGDVRCWPHHFDIATLVSRPGGVLHTIGIGMSPGDGSYGEPYFYVAPDPRPATPPSRLTVGHWHTRDWWAAVLTASEIVGLPDAADQASLVTRFIDEALAALLSSTHAA